MQFKFCRRLSSRKMSSRGRGLRCSSPPRSAGRKLATSPCTPPRNTRARMARTPRAPRSDSNLARVLRSTPNDTQALERVLQDDPSSAILPLNGKPVLVVAMVRQCSLATLRVLLDYGAQLKQETLDALLAMTVPDAFEGNFQIYKHAQPRSCSVSTRLHVRYALFLLNLGVRASPHAPVR